MNKSWLYGITYFNCNLLYTIVLADFQFANIRFTILYSMHKFTSICKTLSPNYLSHITCTSYYKSAQNCWSIFVTHVLTLKTMSISAQVCVCSVVPVVWMYSSQGCSQQHISQGCSQQCYLFKTLVKPPHLSKSLHQLSVYQTHSFTPVHRPFVPF